MILFRSGAHRRLRRLWRSHGQGLQGGVNLAWGQPWVNLACLREWGLPGRWPWSWPLTMMLTVKTVYNQFIARFYLQPPSLMLFFLNDTYLSISWSRFSQCCLFSWQEHLFSCKLIDHVPHHLSLQLIVEGEEEECHSHNFWGKSTFNFASHSKWVANLLALYIQDTNSCLLDCLLKVNKKQQYCLTFTLMWNWTNSILPSE